MKWKRFQHNQAELRKDRQPLVPCTARTVPSRENLYPKTPLSTKCTTEVYKRRKRLLNCEDKNIIFKNRNPIDQSK
jgi:hypothetical protein